MIPDQKALAIDALSILWDKMIAYAYPPICHIPKISSHMKQFQCQIILIAPHIYCIPIRLPPRADLLFLPRSNIYHPDPKISFLTAWHLSTKILKIMLKRNYLNFYQHYGEKEHRLTTIVNSESSVVGVLNRIQIPIQCL